MPRRRTTTSLRLEALESRQLLTTVVQFNTALGSFQVELFDDTPITTQNFLNYAQRGAYDETIIHRSAYLNPTTPFVVQGGGFNINGSIPQDAQITNEFRHSNVRGTIAMAKLGGNPNSATNQWFFNLGNNSANLDNQNGGFTVFGQVLGSGMQVVDALAAVPRFNKSNGDGLPAGLNSARSALTDLPLRNYTNNPTTTPVTLANLLVIDVNSPPQLVSNQTFRVGRGETLTLLAGQLTAVDHEQLPAAVTYVITRGPTHGSLRRSGVAVTSFTQDDLNNNRITYVHDSTSATADSFEFRVDDGAGSSIGPRTATIAIASDPPIAGSNNPLTLAEGAAANISSALLSTTDPDTGVTRLVYTVTVAPQHGQILVNGQAASSFSQDDINQNRVRFQHDGDESTTDRFQYTVSDGFSTLPSRTFNFTITPVNDIPTLTLPSVNRVLQGGSLFVPLTVQDAESSSDQLVVSLDGALPPGASFDAASRQFNWNVPADQAVGEYRFTFRVRDTNQPPAESQQTLVITVEEPNRAPQLGGLPARLDGEEHRAVSFVASGSDPNRNPVQRLRFSLLNAPNGAVIDATTGQFSWTPGESDGGQSFTFQVRVTDDGLPALFDERSITIAVAERNDPPILTPFTLQVVQGGTVLFQVAATDPDTPIPSLSYDLGPGAPAGLEIDPQTGLITWRTAADQLPGTYDLRIDVSDPQGLTTSVTAQITVTPPFDASQLQSIRTEVASAATILGPVAPVTQIAFGIAASGSGGTAAGTDASSSETSIFPSAAPNFTIGTDTGVGRIHRPKAKTKRDDKVAPDKSDEGTSASSSDAPQRPAIATEAIEPIDAAVAAVEDWHFDLLLATAQGRPETLARIRFRPAARSVTPAANPTDSLPTKVQDAPQSAAPGATLPTQVAPQPTAAKTSRMTVPTAQSMRLTLPTAAAVSLTLPLLVTDLKRAQRTSQRRKPRPR